MKRNSLTEEKKLKLLNEVDKGRKKRDIWTVFGIPKTTLSTIQKNCAQYECTDLSYLRNNLRGAKPSNDDEALLIWMRQALAMGTSVNGPPAPDNKGEQLGTKLGHS